nr:TPM domain-containing protein [Paracoccus marinaquae]
MIWLALALPPRAQDLPEWQHTSINDFAGLLGGEDTRLLDQALIALHDETGIEGTVVTLPDRARHGGRDGLEPFATPLFNDWGVGDARRNDGFMVLVLRDDREARIELGAGYPATADVIAQEIMDEAILPRFRSDRMSEGLRDGTLAVIDRIARPTAEGRPLQAPSRRLVDQILPLAMLGAFGFILVRIGRDILARIRHAHRPCPVCGGRGLTEEVEPLSATDAAGKPVPRQSVWTRCPRCGWSRHSIRDTPAARSRSRRGGFGGGRSSGGGASGRW